MKKILLKLSGEALLGKRGYGIDVNIINDICSQIKSCVELGYQIAIVIGGGNIFRGVSASLNGMDRNSADYVGMLATVMNCISLNDGFHRIGVDSVIFSAIEVKNVVYPYIQKKALRKMESGKVVIFAGGTGNPYFTTDTAAALRANEMDCDLLLKATKVDGVYSKDPVEHKDAIFYDKLTYDDVIEQKLKVMDLTAITLCSENDMPLRVFNMLEPNAIIEVVTKENRGTIVTASK